MRENYTLTIEGKLVQLVPYRKKFVVRYHEWMKSEELLTLTASEPLTLEEEYSMQMTWKKDPLKCTFIVLSSTTTTSSSTSQPIDSNDSNHHHNINNNNDVNNDINRMIGDVNLFLGMDYSIEDGRTPIRKNAEIDIMIAESRFRQRGCGREAVCLMLYYGLVHLHIQRVFAKIHQSNTSSKRLFESLGFEEVNFVEAFQEYELSYDMERNREVVLKYGELGHIRDYPLDSEEEEGEEKVDGLS